MLSATKMVKEQITLHENFESKFLPSRRNLMVYLPPGYGIDPTRRYPVMYMHDGQNLVRPEEAFGGVAWAIDETANRLAVTGEAEPIIIVGVHNTHDRVDEYTHVAAEKGKMRGKGGKADLYGRMLIDEIKPFIDENYLTRPEREYTGIGGSSLGGLVSMYLSIKRPNVFSRVAVMSPAAWWANNQIIRDVARLGERLPLRIWLDIGKREGPRIKHQVRALKEMLLANGWQLGADLAYAEVPEAKHEESAWAARFGEVIKFLYPVLPGL
jgi:predicted alpha/beta superfamily hydrolase